MNELNGKYLEIQRLTLKKRCRRICLDEEEMLWQIKEPGQENRPVSEKEQNPADYIKQLEEIVAEAQRLTYDIPLEKNRPGKCSIAR